MAIVETSTPSLQGISGGIEERAWGLVGGKPTKFEVAYFVIVDVAPLFFGFALLSGIRKAGYIRKLIKAEQTADKAADSYRLGRAASKAADEMPVRTGLFVASMIPSTLMIANPALWNIVRVTTDTGEDVFIQYMDRQGKIVSFLPSDDLLSELLGSRGGQGAVLPAAQRPRSFFDKDGIERLSSFKRPRTPIPKWSFTTRSRKGLARGNPLAEGPGSRGRSPPSRRGKTISPYCPVHRRRHWCNVTRGKN